MDFEKLEPNDRMKYEIAEELGLLAKVREGGWKALSARETGRIGGILSRRKKALENSMRREEQE
ncbi:MAG: alpha/beta-type small acid-soluble spore protein [Lachnospiraceae bacterium]|nr:alpha/beta-type small acid-soluble spore protein [Lachnospiraceae bacterium]